MTVKTTKKKEEVEVKPKIRIRLRSFDHKVIEKSAQEIISILLREGAEVKGPVPLPTEIHKYTVNRSTFVHKDAREQFEMRIHKRLIDVTNINPRIIDSLRNLNLPAGVDIEIKMM
jgi:small subunit ribosomal protein S10